MASCSALVTFNGLANGVAAEGGADATGLVDAGPDAPLSAEDAAPDAAFFADDFDRADGGPLGNGWLMKAPDAFTLSSGTVLRLTTTTEYTDNIVYRPGENLGDLKISAEVNLIANSGPCAQLHARVQSSVTKSDQLDDYIFFIECSPTSIALLRQHGNGGSFVKLSSTNIPTIKGGDRLRLTFSVTGADNVALVGTAERAGQDGMFVMLGMTSFLDTDPTRIRTPGSYGFSAASDDKTAAYSYDVFRRTSL